ncbi:MAG: PQQ-binding-like beta-propeller repeat protein [Planctomycetes bacterium]|nr:PQQ-binding-like beta-propeller repeat protein [Planctomycetota bacterium]
MKLVLAACVLGSTVVGPLAASPALAAPVPAVPSVLAPSSPLGAANESQDESTRPGAPADSVGASFPSSAASAAPERSLERRLVAYAALEAGELDRAEQLFTAELARFPEDANSAYALACVAARRGALEQALAHLGRAVELGFADALVAGADEDLAALRALPRFAELLTTMARRAAPAQLGARLVWTIENQFASYTSDGSRLVAGRGGDGSILDARNGELVACITYDERGLAGVTPQAAGPLAATTAFDLDVAVWDTFEGRLLWRRNVPGTWACTPQWERSGASFLCAGRTPDADSVRLDATTGSRLADFGHAPEGAWISPDGARVFTLRRTGERESVLALRDARTGGEIVHLDVAGMPMHQGGFAPSSTRFWCLSLDAGEVHVFDARDAREVAVLRGRNGKVQHALGMPDRDEVVGVDGGKELVWWDLANGAELRRVDLAHGNYGGLDVSARGDRLFSSSWGDALRVLDARSGERLWQIDAQRSSRWVFGGAFRDDGEELALPFGDALVIHDARTGRVLRTLAAPSLNIEALVPSPDSERAWVATDDGTLRVIELPTGRTVASYRPRAQRIDTLRFVADGARVLVGWHNGSLGWVDASSGALVRSFERTLDVDWTDAAVSSDGRRVISRWSGGDALLLDGESGGELAKLGPAGWNVAQVIHDATRRVAAAQSDGSVALFDLETGVRSARTFATGDHVSSLALSPDGATLACGTVDAGLFVWRVEDGELLRRHQVPDVFDASLDVRALEFEAEGKTLVYTTGDYGTARRLDLASGSDQLLYDTSGGNAGTMYARPSVSGKRLYVHGMVAGDQPVLDARNGAPLLKVEGRGLGFVDGTRDDRWVVGTIDHGMRVFGESLDPRYTYVPFVDGGFLVQTESLHCIGTVGALRWAVVVRGDETYPFASCASELLDPKRVRAAAAGVGVRAAELGLAPSVRIIGEPIRSLAADATTIELELETVAPRGIAACEADLDGVPLDELATRALARDATSANPSGAGAVPQRVTLRLPRTPGAGSQELRLVVFDRSGLGSRVARTRFIPER